MAVKGKQKEVKEGGNQLSVGFTTVKLVAVNPTREELNKLLGNEDGKTDEIVYLGSDDEGHSRLRLTFLLEDTLTGRIYFYSFNLTDKERKNKEGDKCQLINSTCSTSWLPYKKDKEGNVTSEVDESLMQDWFSNFTDKDKNKLGAKKWRKALAGEEELGTLLRSWLGRMNFSDPETEVMIDTKKLFKENYKELRSLISLTSEGEFSEEGFDTPFVVLLGVRTDDKDNTKKYQQIWKSFLPDGFMRYVNNGLKFPSDYTKRVWKKFKEDVEGDYGFNGYTELVALTEYDASKDITDGKKTAKEAPAPTNSDY